jgi:mono/diheme cytochrome c family protein
MKHQGWLLAWGLAFALIGVAFATSTGSTPQVPQGWHFAFPEGDAWAGGKVFVKMECFSCHKVAGRSFRRVDSGGVGPELGPDHAKLPPEYLAESILNRHKIVAGNDDRYRGEDKRGSKMGDYSEIMTVRELVDVVAYIMSIQ